MNIGVASVLLGTTLFFGTNVAHADTNTDTAQTATTATTTASPSVSSTSNATQPVAQTNTATSANTNTATSTQSAVSSANTTTVNTNSLTNAIGNYAVNASAVSSNSSTNSSNGGTIPVTVDHENLDLALQHAKDEDMVITQYPTVSQTVTQDQVHQAIQDVEEDYKDQSARINADADNYHHEKENVKKYNGTNGDSAEFTNVVNDAKHVSGLNVVNDGDKHFNINANDNAINAWEQQTSSDYNNQIAQLKQAIANQEAINDQYARDVINAKQRVENSGNPNNTSGATGDKSWTNLSAKDLGNGMRGIGVGNVSSVNDLRNGNYSVVAYLNSGTVDAGHIIESIYWNNGVNPIAISGNLYGGADPTLASMFSGSHPWGYELWHVTSGTIIRIPGIVRMQDGSPHDLIVKYDSYGDALQNSNITLRNDDGALVYSQSKSTHTHNYNNITATYWIDNVNNNQNYLWVTAEADIDVSQRLRVNGASLLSVGGDLVSYSADGNVDVQASSENDLNSVLDTPSGTIVYAHYGSNLSKNLSNSNSANGGFVADSDFGVGVHVNVPVYRTSETHYHYDVADVKTTPNTEKTSYYLNDLNVHIDPVKDWKEYGTEVTDSKNYFAGDTASADLHITINDADHYDNGLKSFVLDDDFTQYQDHVTFLGAKVTENGQDVTNLYHIQVQNLHSHIHRYLLTNDRCHLLINVFE